MKKNEKLRQQANTYNGKNKRKNKNEIIEYNKLGI